MHNYRGGAETRRRVRIIAGSYKGRRLKKSPPPGIRPTSDKLRETLFNILGGRVRGSVFLDGYAGMGGVGLEALSRGASLVCFVDQSPRACRLIRQALTAFHVDEGFKVLEMDLSKALDLLFRNQIAFDVAFLDPPYDREDYRRDLGQFAENSLLSVDGILVVEHSKRVKLPDAVGNFRRTRHLIQGDSALSFYRLEKA